MTPTKLLKFLVIVFGFGLAQTWAVGLILWYKKIPIELGTFLQDGSFFFFSTSLVYTSFYTLLESVKLSESDKLWAFSAILIVTTFAIVGYSIEFAEALTLHRQALFSDRFGTGQIVCIATAGMFSIYSSIRSGLFRRTRYVTF